MPFIYVDLLKGFILELCFSFPRSRVRPQSKWLKKTCRRKEVEEANMATSSRREAPSESKSQDQKPPILVIAEVHVPAESRWPEPKRERPGAIMADNNEDEQQVFSQEPQRQMLEMLREWKRDNTEKLIAVDREIAMQEHEIKTLRKRIREVEAAREKIKRRRERLLMQRNANTT